jgi:hypothetical protein
MMQSADVDGIPNGILVRKRRFKLYAADRRTRIPRRRLNPLAGFLPIVTAMALYFSDRRVLPDRRFVL